MCSGLSPTYLSENIFSSSPIHQALLKYTTPLMGSLAMRFASSFFLFFPDGNWMGRKQTNAYLKPFPGKADQKEKFLPRLPLVGLKPAVPHTIAECPNLWAPLSPQIIPEFPLYNSVSSCYNLHQMILSVANFSTWLLLINSNDSVGPPVGIDVCVIESSFSDSIWL